MGQATATRIIECFAYRDVVAGNAKLSEQDSNSLWIIFTSLKLLLVQECYSLCPFVILQKYCNVSIDITHDKILQKNELKFTKLS